MFVVQYSFFSFFSVLKYNYVEKKMSNPKKQIYFVDGWLDDPQFKDWLVKDKQNTRA